MTNIGPSNKKSVFIMDTEVQSDVGLKEIKKFNCVKKQNEINNVSSSFTQSNLKMGGRLQFFKDGKFILELARSKVGDKFSWVSVPKQIASVSAQSSLLPKNESCTSLSDDNSSVQSSSWQREHIWRKSLPRKNISKEMCMIFKRPKNDLLFSNQRKITRVKRRRPYDSLNNLFPLNKIEKKSYNKISSNISQDSQDKGDVPKYKMRIRKTLPHVIKKLTDKMETDFEHLSKNSLVIKNNNLATNASRLIDTQYQSNVSPRKRILKELEKVTLEDNTKRSRPKHESSSPTNKPNLNSLNFTKTNQISDSERSQFVNCKSLKNNSIKSQTKKCCTIPSAKLYSSYSIHALLGNVNKNENLKKVHNSMFQEPRSSNEKSIFTTPTAKLSPKSPNFSQQDNKNDQRDLTTGTKTNHKVPESLDVHKSSYMTVNNVQVFSEFINQNTEMIKNNALELQKKTDRSACMSIPDYETCIISPNEYNYRQKDKGSFGNPLKKTDNGEDIKLHSNINFQSGVKNSIAETSINSNKHNINSNLKTLQRNTHAHIKSSFMNSRNENKISDNDFYSEQPTKKENSGLQMSAVCSAGFLGTHNSLSSASLYYMYPENSSLSGAQTNNSSYISPCTYFHPYPTLRDPLWLHYQSGLSLPAPIARLPSPAFQFNRINTHLITNQLETLDQKKDTLVTQDDCNLDMPLNLSKH